MSLAINLDLCTLHWTIKGFALHCKRLCPVSIWSGEAALDFEPFPGSSGTLRGPLCVTHREQMFFYNCCGRFEMPSLSRLDPWPFGWLGCFCSGGQKTLIEFMFADDLLSVTITFQISALFQCVIWSAATSFIWKRVTLILLNLDGSK